MAVRTNDDLVRASIDVSSTLNLAAFIRRANALTDYVVSKDSNSVLTTALLLEIETCLACHFCARRDPQYREKNTGKAGAVFQGKSGMRLDSTDWGQDAITLDVTGTLAGLNAGKRKASVTWLGLPPSEQTDVWDRD